MKNQNYEMKDLNHYKNLLDDLKQPYFQVNQHVLLIFPTSSPMLETLPQTKWIQTEHITILEFDITKYDQTKYGYQDNVDYINEYISTR